MIRDVRRETRVNLIFLVVFLAVSLPGAVILVRKRLQPGAPRMDQPDVMVTRLPYMTPPPAPPGVKWIVPDQTRAWLEQVMKERTGNARMLSSAPPGPQWEPVISDNHLLQVMSATSKDGGLRLAILLWNGQMEPSASHCALTVNGTTVRVAAVAKIPVPPAVRQELVRLDYPRPPEHIVWLEAEAEPTNSSKISLTLEYTGVPAPSHASLEFAR
jgi:hypothetical protein